MTHPHRPDSLRLQEVVNAHNRMANAVREMQTSYNRMADSLRETQTSYARLADVVRSMHQDIGMLQTAALDLREQNADLRARLESQERVWREDMARMRRELAQSPIESAEQANPGNESTPSSSATAPTGEPTAGGRAPATQPPDTSTPDNNPTPQSPAAIVADFPQGISPRMPDVKNSPPRSQPLGPPASPHRGPRR